MEKLHYDVFISYRHGELDGFIAERLHKMLETYRVPNAVAQKIGKKKLSRVFRDRDELPTSSNLSDSINDALVNSDFLLLICSKRTCQSQWVMREVETFGELHGKDKIITLLIDGEPDESFPEGLRERKIGNEIIFVEPLAADIRAHTDGTPVSKTRDKSWDRSLKLLRTEEKLRLLAPILGCAYDNLRRRHRRRLIQKTAACIGAVFALTLSFGAFSTYQYLQIDHQMQLKLENESYVFAEYSATALANGDRDEAIRLALDALPQNLNKPERPFVITAERALANALGIYDVSDTFKPHKTAVFPAAPTKVILSPGEKYAAAVFPFSVAVINTESGDILHNLPALKSILADVQFLSDNIIVYSGADGITAYDIESNAILWQGGRATTIAVSDDKSRVAAVLTDENKAVVYSADGAVIAEVDFGGKKMRTPAEDLFNPNDRLFALNSNGSRLAVSFDDGSVSVYDVSNIFENVILPQSDAGYFQGGFYENALFFSAVFSNSASCKLFLYSPDLEPLGEYNADSLITAVAGDDGLYVSNGNMLALIDVATGEFYAVLSAGGTISSFSQSNGVFIINETSGDYRFAGGLSGVTKTYSSDSVNHFTDLGNTYALTGSRDSRTVRILKRAVNRDNIFFSYPLDYSFSEAKVSNDSSRVMLYSYTGFRLYSADSTLIAEQNFPNPFDVLDTMVDKASGNIAVIYADKVILYSGIDGELLDEFENFGSAVLFDFNNPRGQALTTEGGRVLYEGEYVADGEIIGVLHADGNRTAFAVSDGAVCRIFTAAPNSAPAEKFTTDVRGRAEVYFTGDYVFISPMHGDAKVYNLDGVFIRAIEENAYMTETEQLGEYIAAGYVNAYGERYTLILAGEELETRLEIRGFTGLTGRELLLLDDSAGSLHTRELYSTEELVSSAKER
ncbi:MAG: toll/interleukin-1 receptor domain-containing protein [Oscillospiraceae bacterium]|nr:toll/interleukin-1 receptor domain-containing protein [Oscillospiraceae bacterium]